MTALASIAGRAEGLSVPRLRDAASPDWGNVIGMPPWLELRAAFAAAAIGGEEEGHPLSRSEASAWHPGESLPRAEVVMAMGARDVVTKVADLGGRDQR